MASGASVKASVKRALAKLNATQAVWQFRLVTHSGGNSRLGIFTGTTTTTDTAIDPQPAEQLLKAEDVATSGGLFAMGDYKLTLHGDVDETLLRTQLMVRGSDVCRIVSYHPAGVLNGVVVAWEVIARVAKPSA